MGPYGYADNGTAQDRREAALKAEIAGEFPGLDIHSVFGGFEAVPAGTPVIRSASLDGLREKLAERRDEAAG
jgi:hypothetical protein